MKHRFWVGWALILVIPGLLSMSCAKKTIKSEPPTSAVEQEKGGQGVSAEQDARARQQALEAQRLEEERLHREAAARRERAEKEAFVNEMIHFEFDQSRLLPEAKAILKKKARWLLAHPKANIVIEGHCDERGSNEYNLALGDRRAQSAKHYLVDLGISPDRMTTISYGEERPLVLGHNETAWAKNRRAQFVIE
ncbi:MAG: peptidoglycan-associated lipoprotein Pal [Deltaproteobacteria bacterium]|nr:peptidoglycan-associated lipoprotein Pal [Deltaproteobacteria bacterium]